jgi:inner membrane transporter RhtA
VVADRFSGVSGLSLTVPVAAITAAVVGIPQAVGHLSVEILMEGAGLALLMPVVPFAFELLALRRMTNSAFGTLMAVEPAIGVLFGILFFNQVPSLAQVGGIVLVVLAGAAGQRLGSRESPGPSGSAAESPLEATAVNDEGTRALPPA